MEAAICNSIDMAGLTLAQRDLAETREQLRGWVEHRFGPGATVSELSAANRAAGWSSETLAFSVGNPAGSSATSHDYVIRIPPSGGGMFAHYDFVGQTRTQELLRAARSGDPVPRLLRARLVLDRFALHGDAAYHRAHTVGHVLRDSWVAARRRARCATTTS